MLNRRKRDVIASVARNLAVPFRSVTLSHLCLGRSVYVPHDLIYQRRVFGVERNVTGLL